MNKNKLLYEQPGCKILVVRFEGNLLTGSPFGQKGSAGGVMNVNDLGDDDESLY